MDSQNVLLGRKQHTKRDKSAKSLKNNWDLYLLILPVLIYFIIFCYWPMYGVLIAFKDFNPVQGVMGSPWVGFKHFINFFKSPYFLQLLSNTLGISIYQLIVGFPAPIILALMMNEIGNKFFKKSAQTITYAPHFISTVVMVGMLTVFLAPDTGLINLIIKAFGGESIPFLIRPEWFKTIYVFSDIWQSTGWSSIIYMAALSNIDQEMYEAATVDGANKWAKLRYITLPCLIPTAIILLILNVGSLMGVGFEKVFLMQNDLNMEASDVISTYVYRRGIQGAQYSFSAAVGLFNSVVNSILLVTVNKICKKAGETSLW